MTVAGSEVDLKRESLRKHSVFLLILIFAGVFLPFAIRDGNDWGGDFSIYILQARNFAEHKPFTTNSYVPTPEPRLSPAVYPPLPSLLLAPVYAIYGLNYRALKLVSSVYLWLSLPVYYILGLRRGVPPAWMAVALLFFVLSPMVLTLEQIIGSDIPFLLTAGAAILGIEEIYRRGWDVRYPLAAAGGTTLLLVLSYLTRATGLALIGGWLAYELLRRRRVRLFSFVVVAGTGLLLVGYTRFGFDASQQYGSQFVLKPDAWIHNLIVYFKSPAEIWGAFPALLRYPLTLMLLGAAGVGFLRSVAARPGVAELYVLAFMVILGVYWMPVSRYMLPIMPFLMIYAAATLARTLSAGMKGVRRKAVVAGLTVCSLAVTVVDIHAAKRNPIEEGVTQVSFGGLCEFLRRNTPANGLILSWNPRVIALYTDKRSALFPHVQPPEEFEKVLPRDGPVFLIDYAKEEDRQELDSYLKYASARLVRVFENADFKVYAIQNQVVSALPRN